MDDRGGDQAERPAPAAPTGGAPRVAHVVLVPVHHEVHRDLRVVVSTTAASTLLRDEWDIRFSIAGPSVSGPDPDRNISATSLCGPESSG